MHSGKRGDLRRRPAAPLRLGTLTVAAAGPALARFAFGRAEPVNMYDWDAYIGETTLKDFSDATGIAVRYDLYASNNKLFGKLREGNPGYDVIFPTNDYVERMIAADMLLPLDHAEIPNLANIDAAFADPPFDRGLGTARPSSGARLGSATALLLPVPRRSLICSRATLCRPELAAGSVESVRAALEDLGYSLDAKAPAQIAEAADTLIRIKPKIEAFTPDTGQDC